MKYIAILGRQPELGLAELESLLGAGVQRFGAGAAGFDSPLDLNRLGGTIKVGRVLYHGPVRDLNETPLTVDELPVRDGKTTFGLSYYGLRVTTKFVTASGLTLKKRLRGRGSVRLVIPQTGTTLTAAQVKFNGLTRTGFELLVVASESEMVVALTEQVQDIDAYAARDYARPSRSASVGMLPPKLAQIMVNTAVVGERMATGAAPLVYDPFCGTGVVLQEALLLGYGAGGSDLSEAMVTASQENITWLRERLPDLPVAAVTQADARQVKLPPAPLAVVSEGYLGPHLSRQPTAAEAATLQHELGELYAASLRHWAAQMESGSAVTITAPAWRTAAGWHDTKIIDRLPDLGYTLRSFATVDSRKLVYQRPQQIVGRQLLIMKRT
jgi:tRNA G10  N-methylase Trm11